MKSKIHAIFLVIIALFILSNLYLHSQNTALARTVVANRLQCEHRLAQLRTDYQAEIEDLRHYIGEQYNHRPGSRDQTDGNAADRSIANFGDEKLAKFAAHKYRYLLAGLAIGAADRERLMQLLLEREHIVKRVSGADAGNISADVSNIPPYEPQLAEIDRQIGGLLDAVEYQKYELLKESDPEQQRLDGYLHGINHVAPMSPGQEQAILFAKLRHKKIFEVALWDSGVYRGLPSAEERAHAHAVIKLAIFEYKKSFLEEVRPLLDTQQFILLDSYETAEFDAELERLQGLIGAE